MTKNGVQNKEAVFRKKRRISFFPRGEYSRDADRIMNSTAFVRYLDKTQVYPFEPNDFISRRIIHINLLRKIGYYLGKEMGLNKDLIDAIALGHDIGHAPFGHAGEDILSGLTENILGYKFLHNVQSCRWLDKLEIRASVANIEKQNLSTKNQDVKYYHGLNLSLQTLDGILHHNGEDRERFRLKPSFSYSFDELRTQIKLRKQLGNKAKRADIAPATMEGCIIRFADTISYIARDIDDAIKLEKIETFPATTLGKSRDEIISNLMKDLIKNSKFKITESEKYIGYSTQVHEQLNQLYKHNWEKIYKPSLNKEGKDFLNDMFKNILQNSLNDISDVFNSVMEDAIDIKKHGAENSHKYLLALFTLKSCMKHRIYEDHIRHCDPHLDQDRVYNILSLKDNEIERLKFKIAIDYLSGMTDRYCISTYCFYNNIDLTNIDKDSEIGKITRKIWFREKFEDPFFTSKLNFN